MPKNSMGTPITIGGRVIPTNRGSISICSSGSMGTPFSYMEAATLSTIAGAPKTRIIPVITDPAVYQGIRPVIHSIPRQTTAMIAMIRAQVLVRRSCKA